MMITKIFIIRHGESEANRDDICGGDTPLTQKGFKQAKDTKAALKNFHFDEIFSSDLERAVDTAGIIGGREVPPANRWAEFRERDFGSLENQPVDKWMVIKDDWEAKYRHLPFAKRSHIDYAHDIESDAAVCDRVLNGLRKLAVAHAGQTLLVVSSAGPLRVLLMDLGFADFLTVGSLANTGYVELDFDGQKFWIQNTSGVQKPASN